MKISLKIVIALWAIAVGYGMVWLTDYASRPGRAAVSPAKLPAKFFDRQSETLPKLLVFLHPQCSCSGATIYELARLMARYQNSVDVRVFFYQPSNQTEEWTHTDLWRQASVIPQITVEAVSEREIKDFGALTSGQTMLYNAEGELVFSGGITASRGHAGDNNGRDSIENYLRTGVVTAARTPVFGCALTNAE